MHRCVTCCSRGALILLLTLLTTGAAWAQATAQLSGTVRDESAAVLPGVTVTVRQTERAWFAPPSPMRTAATS